MHATILRTLARSTGFRKPSQTVGLTCLALLTGAGWLLFAGVLFAQPAAPASASAEADQLMQAWPYFQEAALPAGGATQQLDFVLTPSVFDKARTDLGDLRLVDATGREVPYVLRIRRAVMTDQTVSAREFNRAQGPNESNEVTLDLGENPSEHNAVEVALPDMNYRRRAQLEGSDDNKEWKTMVEHKDLVRFRVSNGELDDRRVEYPASRFRYLRLRVYRDPQIDKQRVEPGEVSVRHKVEAPGEFVKLPAKLEPREPINAGAGPGSAWMLDLGWTSQPCLKILAEIGDKEFARDLRVEATGPAGLGEPFVHVMNGSWSRRAGDAVRPMEVEFEEQQAARLRLVVTDYLNPPLDLRSVEFVGAARQVIFARDEKLQGPLRLYYGNPKAELPHYDVERSLPMQLAMAPERLVLGELQENPDYVPPPLPLTERLPWLIYVVLGAASLVLAWVIANLGRSAVVLYDTRQKPNAAV